METLRSVKIDDMAIFDFVATFAVGELAKWYFGWKIPRIVLYSILVLLAIVVHYLVGQETELNRKLFKRQEKVYLLLVFCLIAIVLRHITLHYITFIPVRYSQ